MTSVCTNPFKWLLFTEHRGGKRESGNRGFRVPTLCKAAYILAHLSFIKTIKTTATMIY